MAWPPLPLALAAPAILAGVAATACLSRCSQLMRRLKAGDRLADAAVAFERAGKAHAPSVLVVGDSTGVGTGATRPEDSIAGRLAATFPDVSIVNRARNGAKTLDAIMQLADEAGHHYDLVLVHVGGNDALRATPIRALAPQVDALMRRALRISNHVVVTTLPNIGLLPIFFPPLSWWFSRRSRAVSTMFAREATRHRVHYVDFFHSRPTPQFHRKALQYFACDGLHPSSDLYRYVYETVMASTPINALLHRPRLRSVDNSGRSRSPGHDLVVVDEQRGKERGRIRDRVSDRAPTLLSRIARLSHPQYARPAARQARAFTRRGGIYGADDTSP